VQYPAIRGELPVDLSISCAGELPMAACELAPKDKKKLVGDVGQELVRKHGKRKYYAPSQIHSAAETTGYGVDFHCWAYCMFASPADFRALHDAAGETCNYAAMRAEVLVDLASGNSFALSDIGLSWLEWPDIDLCGLFDWFDLPS
jgi:hypothetical protein